MQRKIQIKRIYESPSDSDGLRVLADRLWPRGVSKEEAKLDVWAKELAPSNDLRKWLHEDYARYDRFVSKYEAELNERHSEIQQFCADHQDKTTTLLTSTKQIERSHTPVLKAYLERVIAEIDPPD
ncbi:MAG: DUF488 domain-containing protein [Blastopirellula sp. JB062]